VNPRFVVVCLVASLIGCSSEPDSGWHPSPLTGDASPDSTDAPLPEEGGPLPDSQTDALPDADSSVQETAAQPFVQILSPTEGEQVPNPVTFQFTTGGSVQTVWFEVDGYALQSDPIAASAGTHTYTFSGVNVLRTAVLQGRDGQNVTVATDEVTFIPVSCMLADQPGFNHYTVQAINDTIAYPKNGTYPYCWGGQGDSCNGDWGMVHDGYYGGEVLFSGGGDCFCSGHTLEVFLRAYRAWQTANGVSESVPYEVDSRQLLDGDIDPYGSNGGEFYQYWQGFGITNEASSADAFAAFGIGREIPQAEWDQALAGDYVNLSRSTGSGHAVIFIAWVMDNGTRVGLRYYGCNGSGESCPDPNDPENTDGNSGPSFQTELFEGHGGTVLPQYLFIGRAFEPTGG